MIAQQLVADFVVERLRFARSPQPRPADYCASVAPRTGLRPRAPVTFDAGSAARALRVTRHVHLAWLSSTVFQRAVPCRGQNTLQRRVAVTKRSSNSWSW